jgi:hypothetical protein
MVILSNKYPCELEMKTSDISPQRALASEEHAGKLAQHSIAQGNGLENGIV